ncbi:hypothetical protein PIIN_03528 [Serendipita indica DSM 11827]|uniref:Uncharacterized protein n=1 Tax=Serendipita indica (strain DSM 11827) TaxID=1109443 RepID=G4TE35_SERID|nr:hypothetical protein PIIN_03528 [Serendipita indica DSM 11827]
MLTSTDTLRYFDTMRSIANSYNYSGDVTYMDAHLLEKYNQAVRSRRAEEESRQKWSPDQLPYGLWTAIIEEVISDEGRLRRHQSLLLLTLVSSRWASLLLQSATLWTNIIVESSCEDLEAMVATFLHLSGDCSLTLDYSSVPPLSLQTIIQPYLSRVNVLTIRPATHRSPAQFFVAEPVFPILKYFTFHGPTPGGALATFISHCTPFAKYASLVPEQCDYVSMKGSHGILTGITKILNSQSISQLPKIESLKEVVLLERSYERVDKDAILGGSNNHGSLGWSTLYADISWHWTEYFANRCTQTLKILQLSLEWIQLPDLHKLLSKLYVLNCLHVSFEYTQNIIQPVKNDLIQSIRNNLMAKPTHSNLQELYVQANTLRLSSSDLEYTLRLLLQHSESWRWIEIDVFGISNLNPDIFKALPLLQSLVLKTEHDSELLNPHIFQIESLESVALTGSNGMINYFGGIATIKLTYTLNDNSQTNPEQPAIHILKDRWPKLQHLSLHGKLNSPQRVDLYISTSTLTQLSLSGHSLIASTIHYIAQQPEILPGLQFLRLMDCPEWDILLVMLEKRLVAQANGVLPLETIHFRRPLSPLLKRTLAMRLAGYLTNRPSNHKLSTQGNLEGILDPTVTGCLDCHLWHHFCDWPIAVPYDQGNSQSAVDDLAPYPNTGDEVLYSWEIRYHQVARILMPTGMNAGGHHRFSSCQRFDVPSEVSRYSLD